MIPTLLILGATGDLTSRLLLPALAGLVATGDVPGDLRLVGAASGDWDDEQFRRHVRGAVPAGTADDLVARTVYHRVDVTDDAAVQGLVTEVAAGAPVGIYLALPTALVAEALEALEGVALPAGSRIAIEKPFGQDAASAQALNELLARVVGDRDQRAVYRVDHVLGMSSMRNLLTLRQENRVIGATWSDRDVERVEILWDETLDLQGRATYYDRAGALRDVMQNHMIQVLCWVAMEPPAHPTQDDLDAAELEVLRHTAVVRGEDGRFLARRARYTSGILAGSGGSDGGRTEAYVEEEGVDPERDTETYAEVVVRVDTERWRRTTFVLRAGKALAMRRKGVLLHYRTAGTGVSATPGDRPGVDNRLWIGIDGPDEVRLGLYGSTLGPPPERLPVTASAPVPASAHPPYGNVLLDFLSGGSRHAVAAEEPVEAWRIFEPVLAEWDDPDTPMGSYQAGSRL